MQRRLEYASLDPLFNPRSIAIIGASSDPTRVSGRPVQMLRDSGYRGNLYPVNSRRDSIQGLRAWPSIEAIDEPVDLALITVPAAAVEEALQQCCRMKVGAAIVFGSGYAELGEAGRAAQNRLAAVAREGGVRLLGPNCMGVFNVAARAYVTFSTVFSSGWPEPGPIGLISQSGAFASFCYSRARQQGLRLSYGVMTGNEADVDFADCLAWLAMDAQTRVIVGFMEGFANGDKLCAALEIARRQGKPVIILKAGSSPAGVETARSHTAQMAGEDAVFEAAFRQHGAWRAKTLDELFDLAVMAATGPLPARPRAGVITVSGGAGVLISDSAWHREVQLPALSDAAQRRLRERITFAPVHNPIDTTGLILDDATLLPDCLDALATEADVDAVVGFYAGMGTSDAAPAMLTALTAAAARHPKVRQVACVLCKPEVRNALLDAGVAVFDDPDRAIRAVQASAAIAAQLGGTTDSVAVPSAIPLTTPPPPLNEVQALAGIAAAGVPVVSATVVHDVDAAIEAADAIGYPVVLKILSAALPHKSDSGGVALSLRSAQQVRSAFQAMMPPTNPKLAGVAIEGVVVAPMLQGIELIVGLHRDAVFGWVIMVGSGGVHAELFGDRVLRLAPVTPAQAHEMIQGLRIWPLLQGARGRPPADVDALARTVSLLSRLKPEAAVSGIEINPLIVHAEGQGVHAVDCLIA